MRAKEVSVIDLAVRFSLRRRAHRSEYLRGRTLAETGGVIVTTTAPDRADLVVTERGAAYDVTLVSAGGELRATCSCGDSSGVCRHQVAAEQALWRQVTT